MGKWLSQGHACAHCCLWHLHKFKCMVMHTGRQKALAFQLSYTPQPPLHGPLQASPSNLPLRPRPSPPAPRFPTHPPAHPTRPPAHLPTCSLAHSFLPSPATDSAIWASANCGGTTVFLENLKPWIDEVTAKIPGITVHEVTYTSKLDDPAAFFKAPSEPQLPPEMEGACFDVVLVDSPMGWKKGAGQPGRFQPVYYAINMARRCIKAGKKQQVGRSWHVCACDRVCTCGVPRWRVHFVYVACEIPDGVEECRGRGAGAVLAV